MSRQRSRSRGPPAGRVPPNSGYTVRFTGRARSRRQRRHRAVEFRSEQWSLGRTCSAPVFTLATWVSAGDDTSSSSFTGARTGTTRDTDTTSSLADLWRPAAADTFRSSRLFEVRRRLPLEVRLSWLAAAATDTFCLWSSRRHVRREGRGTGWLCSIAANAAKQCGTGNIAGRPDPCHAQQCGA
jgi:hypothetical protein